MKQINRFVLFLILGTCSLASAQLRLVHIEYFPDRSRTSFTDHSNLRTEAITLTLPFWEDFSDTSSLTQKFSKTSGVYFNNHLCVNPPTANVASFDGIDLKGKPYFTTSKYQIGEADSLVSHNIDISGLSKADSLFFNFFYQYAGYSEEPDGIEGDSLELQFYTKAGKWKTVWQSKFVVAKDPTLFYPTLLKVTDSVFFHDSFKFKFRNYGRLSGMFDSWHVDYIVMDTIKKESNQRQIKDGKMYFSDFAISQSPSSLITPYLSAPVNHLNTSHFKTDFDFTLSNLSFGNNSISTNYLQSINSVENVVSTGFAGTIPAGITKVKQPFVSLSGLPIEEFKLVNKVYLNRGIGNVSNYLFERNDTLSSVFIFRNYYAYDDGTYERAVQLDQKNAKIAVGFDLFASDTLTHIDISFPYYGLNIAGSQMNLKVWADDNGKPGKELYSRQETVKYFSGKDSAEYSTSLNPFTRYKIQNKTVLVSGRIYVGYQQIGSNSKALRIGFDKNTNSQQQYWCDNDQGGGWTQLRNLPGSIMIHPVFANGALNISPRLGGEESYDLKISPNPNFGNLNLHEIHDRVIIYNASGQVVMNAENVNELNLTGLQRGFYIVKTYLNGYHSVKKLDYRGN